MPAPNQLEVVISARNEATGELTRLESQLKGLEPTMRAPAQALDYSMRNARGTLQLVSRDLGVTMPRAVQSFLASSSLVGPALSAAFSVAAIGGFLIVLKEVPDAIERVTNALAGWDAAAQQAYQHNLELNKSLLDSAEALKKINEQRQLEGLEGPAAAAKSLEFAHRHTQELQDQLTATMKARDAAQGLIDAWHKQNAPATIGAPYAGMPGAQAGMVPGAAWAERFLFAPADVKQAYDSIAGLNDKVLKLNAQLKISQAEGGLAGDKLKTAVAQGADAAAEAAGRMATRLATAHERITSLIDAANRLAAKQLESPLNQQALAIEQKLAEIERERAAYLSTVGVSQSAYVESLDQASANLQTSLDSLRDKMQASIHASMLDGLTAGLHDFLAGIEAEKLQQVQAGGGQVPLLPGQKMSGLPTFTGAHPGLPELSTEEIGAAANRMQAVMAGLGNTAMIVNNAFAGLFYDLQSGTTDAANAFSNMAQRMLADMASLIEQALIWNLVSTIFGGIGGGGGLGGILGKIFGFMGGGGGVQSFTEAGFMDFLGGYAGPHDFPGRASAGKTYYIGTPEFVSFGKDAYVQPVPMNAGGLNVKVEVKNESSQPVKARSGPTRFDGEQYITTVILRDFETNGAISQAMRSGR